MSASLISQSAYMPNIKRFISHEILESWPDAGLQKGKCCLVLVGRTKPGQIVAIHYQNDLFFNLLMFRDGDGNITVRGSDGIISHLRKGEYEIEGFVAYEDFTP